MDAYPGAPRKEGAGKGLGRSLRRGRWTRPGGWGVERRRVIHASPPPGCAPPAALCVRLRALHGAGSSVTSSPRQVRKASTRIGALLHGAGRGTPAAGAAGHTPRRSGRIGREPARDASSWSGEPRVRSTRQAGVVRVETQPDVCWRSLRKLATSCRARSSDWTCRVIFSTA